MPPVVISRSAPAFISSRSLSSINALSSGRVIDADDLPAYSSIFFVMTGAKASLILP